MNRTTAIILTVASALLCGCPGLCGLLWGMMTAGGLGTYTADMLGTGRTSATPSGYGIAGLCVGLILIAIPFGVGFFTLRRKPGQPKPPAAPPAA